MTRITRIVSTTAALSLASAASGQVIANGSLTGPTGTILVPPSWSIWQATPDTVDASGPLNFTGTPWTLSPDGGTFVHAVGGTFPNSEGFAQTVSGFTAGQTYQIDFFQTNLGAFDPASAFWMGSDGMWQLVVDGAPTDLGTVISKQATESDPVVWSADSFTFTATAATHELAFLARSDFPGGPPSFMGIDGIRLTLVPAPGALAVVGIGVIAAGRRRRH